MSPTDRKAFLEVVLGFAELKGKQLSAPALELYWRSMQHWELADFRAAAEQLVRTCKFFPTPSEFEDLRKAGELTAGEAFEQAMAIARQCSKYEPSTSGNPRIDAAARACGGYWAMGMAETEKLGFLERRFAEHFDAISDAEDVRAALPDLTGGSHLGHDIGSALRGLVKRA